MSVLTASQPVLGEGYFHNIGKAARALLAALVAVRPSRVAADDGLLLCRRYEDMMPNLSNELRFMSSRG